MYERHEAPVRDPEGDLFTPCDLAVWTVEGWPLAAVPCCGVHLVIVRHLAYGGGIDVRVLQPRFSGPCLLCALEEARHVVS